MNWWDVTLDGDRVLVRLNASRSHWTATTDALMMAESLLRVFGHTHQSAQIEDLRRATIAAALVPSAPKEAS